MAKRAFTEIENNLRRQREQGLIRRTHCPECDYHLEVHPETGMLHCRFCGWTEDITAKRGGL